MGAASYRSGRVFEYEVKRQLEALGMTVVRAAGSHSPIDLVGFSRDKGVWLVQCKRKKPSKRERAQFAALEAGKDARKWLVSREKGARLTIWEDMTGFKCDISWLMAQEAVEP